MSEEESFIELWIKGRFGYAIHGVRMAVGIVVTIYLVEYFYPGFLLRTITFSNPMTIAEFLGYTWGASILMIVFYFSGEFWIALTSKITKILFRKIATSTDPSRDGNTDHE